MVHRVSPNDRVIGVSLFCGNDVNIVDKDDAGWIHLAESTVPPEASLPATGDCVEVERPRRQLLRDHSIAPVRYVAARPDKDISACRLEQIGVQRAGRQTAERSL